MRTLPLLLSLICLLLAACASYEDGFGGKYASLGGSATVEFPSGGRLTHSHTKSFQHFTQAAVTAIAGLANASVSKANDAAAAATTQQANAQKSAEALANIEANKAIELAKIPAP